MDIDLSTPSVEPISQVSPVVEKGRVLFSICFNSSMKKHLKRANIAETKDVVRFKDMHMNIALFMRNTIGPHTHYWQRNYMHTRPAKVSS